METIMRKRWIFGILALVLGAGAVIAAVRRTKAPRAGGDDLPFRVGKVQSEDLQVSVREVGAVDPVDKVDVKSAVSGRVTAIRVREGDTVKVGQVLAEVEPDVNQAQSLSDVQGAVAQTEVKLHDAERSLAVQQALFDNGLIPRDALRPYQTRPDLAAAALRPAQSRR